MAHYAFLDENDVVVEVIVGIDETELIEGLSPEEWYANFRGMPCKRTSYNGRIRGRFAGIGYRYDVDADVFVAPQPFTSWVLDSNYDWIAPVPCPTEGQWKWDEDMVGWVEIPAG